jgi:hypothetical protein
MLTCRHRSDIIICSLADIEWVGLQASSFSAVAHKRLHKLQTRKEPATVSNEKNHCVA